MAQVPVRQPRFLDEKVPYREQSTQEAIQEELGPGYTVESSNGGYTARAKPVQYIKERRGAKRTYAEYSPHEIVISPEGKVLKETRKGTFKQDVFSHGQRREVYTSEVTDYEKQTRFTFGKRDMKSGRQTIRQTSSLEGDQYRAKSIIHGDSKKHEKQMEEHELFQTFVGQGKSYAESRKLSRMTEAQREAHFRQIAKERTERFSDEGKAITVKHQTQRQFEKEHQESAQKYAGDIVSQQEAQKEKPPVLESPKPTESPFTPSPAPTPASPTTRTDMGDTFTIPQKKQPGGTISAGTPFYGSDRITDAEQYSQSLQLESDNVVQRQIDKIRFGYTEQAKGIDFHPILSDVIVPVAVGTTNIVLGTVAHPVQAVKSMLDPVGLAKDVRQELTVLTQSKGEVYSLSYLGGTILGAEVLGRGARKGVELAKDVYVKTGSKYVEPETVFSTEVLEGKKTFPTTKSTAQSLSDFNKGGKTYDLAVAEDIVKNPEAYAKPPTQKAVKISNQVLEDIKVSLPGKEVVVTGGVARRVLTGKGRIRDVDVITSTGQADAYAVAKRFPEKYEIIQHEKYPEIYRLREKQTRKVVADFDPPHLAEEGLINPKSTIKVGEHTVVKPEVQLQSKALQIVKGKTRGLKQAENIQQLSPGTPILKDQVIVTTVSPARLKGKTVTGKVEKVGLEDPGIYVSPKGEGSPYFTGIEAGETAYSLNPFKGVFGIPTATEFAVKGVITYPKEVVMRPGFAHLGEFQKSQVGKGQAYITKRSQIGTGDIPRQQFELLEATEMTGETVKPGKRWEAGTSEKEAVIGEGESFEYTPKTFLGKVKGFDIYTKYKGRSVAVREATLLTGTEPVTAIKPGESIMISGEKVKAGQAMFDSIVSQRTVVTPTSSLKTAPYGTLKPVESVKQASSSKPPTITESQVLPPDSSSKTSQKTVSSGVSQLSPGKSVTSNFKSAESSVKQLSEVSRPRGSDSLKTGSSLIGLSSGRSFQSGGSRGGGSRGPGSSGGGSSITREPIREYPKPYSRPSTEPEKKKEQFRVEVREKGVFKTLAVTETPQEAFRLGKVKVEQTASASLRVKPVGSSEKVTGVGKSILPLQKFRESTKEPDVFIQRRKFRIGTPGEKKDITFKGLQVLKHKRIFGRL